ncbi:MAG: HAMP domain-containing histidine kinase [Nitrospirae bacterium]|nr:HAMP domain-containing histidine kinase [Nitrospirota bacterium]
MIWPRSLHAKIFTIFFTTTLLIILSIFFFARSLDTSRKSGFLSVRKNLSVHLRSQIEKIGVPPDLQKAAAIAKELDLKIGISGPGTTWKSDPLLDDSEFLTAKPDSHFRDFRFGRIKGRLFAVSERNGFTYEFEFLSSEFFTFPYRLIIALATIVMIILLMSFVVTRWVMNPVRPLVTGVEELSKGNFEYRIQFQQNDEFGFFAKIFNKMAEQIQQMLKAKDKLLLDVSHELRSPLGRMKVASEMIQEEAMKSSLKEDIHDMEFMIDEILEGYRLHVPQGALKLERIDLAVLLEELTGLYRFSGVGVSFRNTLPGQAWILGDAIRLKKAFTNLIENGIKFSECALSPVELVLTEEGRAFGVKVIDHGSGIRESELNLVFEPFYKMDSAREKKGGGYGLGLSICKEIISAHEGLISVTSRENDFTQFAILLPKA